MNEAAEEFHFSPRPNRASEVNWHAWSPGAFEEARETGRPILLSISAVWCHWCHVMDETTYSHPSVIDIINREFVLGLVDVILDSVRSAYDPEYGGFGNAPKFPQTDAILLLLEQSVVRSDDELRRMAVHTLERMTGGGTYDQVEGGFFRYSTTQDWSVPHFEKMLEDHAGLISALALAGMSEALDKTTSYLARVLRDSKTGLYAGSQDADEHYYSMDAEERTQSQAPYVDRRVYTSWNAALAVAYLQASSPLAGKYSAKPGDGAAGRRDLAKKRLDSLFKRAYRRGEGMTHG